MVPRQRRLLPLNDNENNFWSKSMYDFALNIDELVGGTDEPRAAVILNRDQQVILRREVRVLSEDDLIAVSNEIAATGLSSVDVDQAMAELVEPIRIKWLGSLEDSQGEKPAQDQGAEGAPPVLPRYTAVLPTGGDENAQQPGLWDLHKNRLLANFVLLLQEDVAVQDDVESWREFSGKLTTSSGVFPFRIKAGDFADNGKLKAALFAAGGCELVIHADLDEIRRAISTVSKEAGGVRQRKLTTNFGWTADKTVYLSPSVKIGQDGIEVLDETAEVRVDLGSEMPACHLDLKQLTADTLLRVKRHIVEDLLALNDRLVTHTLLGVTGAAVLYPFAQGAGRFALWLVGLTGSGKSFAAKLFSNFFGNFPVSSAPFTTWSATPNYVQRQGNFFKDTIYLVDDYKPEVVQSYQVVRVLQTYADNTARGRLKADATANVLRPIRGLLVCTGEDLPEHNASAVARSVIVRVPQRAKNVEAGRRCLEECERYSGATADFIHWLLAGGRIAVFERRFGELQKRFNDDVSGQQNDIRIATNLAILGAAFELFAEYLGDVWDGWQEAARRYVEEDLVAIRDSMLGEAKEQQASEVFLRTLGDLIRYERVRLERPRERNLEGNIPTIGRVIEGLGRRNDNLANSGVARHFERFEINITLALAAVNMCLKQQGRSELQASNRVLLQQLRDSGKLLGQDGLPLTGEVKDLPLARFDGRQLRVFAISRQELLGEDGV